MSRLAGFLQVRPGEGRTVLLLGGLTLLLAAGGSLGGNAVDALLFARFGVASLPGLYVALGFCIVASALAFSAALARGARGRFYVFLLGGLAVVLVADRLLLAFAGQWIYPASWLAMNVMSSLQGLVGWGLAGLVCDLRQTRRLFPLFAAGGVLGSVLGGLATRPLAALLQTENLLLAWALALAGAFWLGRVLLAARRELPAPAASLGAELRLGLDTVRGVPMLRWLAAAIVLFSVLFYSLAFPFAAAATRQFPRVDELAGFLGLFQAGSTGVAFLVSLFLANRLFARIGLMSAILTFAALYLAGFLVLLALPGFWPVVLFRFLQIAWLFGIAGTAYHAVFNVIPGASRDAARAFIDGIGTQTGTVIGGLLLLFGQRALPPAGLYAVGAGAAALCVISVWRARSLYLSALLDALRSGQPEVFLPEAEPFRGLRRDAAALRVLRAGLGDPRPERRALAADLLGELAGPEAARDLEPLLADAEPQVRLAAAAAVAGSDPARVTPMVEAFLQAEEPDLRRRAIAILAGARAVPAFDGVAAGLQDPSAAVRREACSALAQLDPARALPLLLAELEHPDPGVREAVAEAAAACGEAARPGLLAQLASPAREEGALLALTHLAPIEAQELAAYRQERSAQALDRFGRHLAARAAGRTPGHRLLADSLLEVARSRALAALRAHGLTRPGNRYEAAISGLSSPSAEQRAKAVETIDSLADAGAVRPLLRIWEDAAAAPAESDWLRRCLLDGDPWIRECAALVEAAEKEGGMADLSGLSAMERVLFLREVPLLADLSPADLKHVAAVTRERLYRGGELLMRQGDSGDEMLIIVSGQVQVLVDGKPVATRRSGEALGEMAILTDEPRSASLRAEGDVRVLSLDAATFQSILRERPEVSLGIIRTLSQRLRERR